MKTSTKRTRSVHTVLGWLSHRRSRGERLRIEAAGAIADRPTTPPVRSERKQRQRQESDVLARGVIRREEVPLLTRYGTSYALFDEWIADYECALTSDACRLGEYVGDSVLVTGPMTGVVGGMPVIDVTRLELLKMKWMRQ